MKHLFKISFFSLFCLFFILSCSKKENSLPEPIDKSYFPLYVGLENIYKVEKIKIDEPINLYDTQRYYIKEKIESTYSDETGNKIYRIELYRKDDSLSNWVLFRAWMAQYVNNQAHKVEENIRYVKLVFPLKINLKWNGNAYNTNETQLYYIKELDSRWNNFEKTCLVIQKEKESLVDKYYQTERYAKNVGLIEKIDIKIEQAYVIQGVPIEQRIKRGEIYRQTIINN